SYTVDRFSRTIDQVLDEVLRKECARSRPRPQHRRLYGDMTRALPDDLDTEFDGRVGVFSWLSHEVSTRSGDGSRPVICLMDGEHKLWARKRELLPEGVVEVLDLWHVMHRLWDVAKALHGADDAASRDSVSQRLRQILSGNVGRVIGGLRQTLTKRRLRKAAAETIASTVTYFSNNRNRMRYDECLREGYPIASGVIEGPCRHVVGDRLDRTGPRWTVEGAISMPATRTTYLSDDWHDYQKFRIKREQTRLHPTAKT
ncbi:MAG: ISKra4 family transposase, partial [Planctomycetales bacterium]